MYPKTIDSGTGETITFLGRKMIDGVEHLELENSVEIGSGPPMHVHHHQNESLTIVEGILTAQVEGEKPSLFYPGETAFFEKGVVHKFWNAGDKLLKCKGTVFPAHNLEYFITEIFRSTHESGNGRPKTFDAAYLLNRYKNEFEMKEVPAFIRKVIFPIAIFSGKLWGLDRRFKDAPDPYEVIV